MFLYIRKLYVCVYFYLNKKYMVKFYFCFNIKNYIINGIIYIFIFVVDKNIKG